MSPIQSYSYIKVLLQAHSQYSAILQSQTRQLYSVAVQKTPHHGLVCGRQVLVWPWLGRCASERSVGVSVCVCVCVSGWLWGCGCGWGEGERVGNIVVIVLLHNNSYIMAVIWCMRREGESPSLHFYRLKGSLTSHTIYAWCERNWPLLML